MTAPRTAAVAQPRTRAGRDFLWRVIEQRQDVDPARGYILAIEVEAAGKALGLLALVAHAAHDDGHEIIEHLHPEIAGMVRAALRDLDAASQQEEA